MTALTAALALASLQAASLAPEQTAWSEQTAQAALDAVREVSRVPGLSLAIAIAPDQGLTLTSGLSDIAQARPVTPATQFRLASVSKLYLASLAARLHQEGRFDLDAPASDFLPDLSPRLGRVTGRQLAAHISGVGHYTEADRWPDLYTRHYDTAIEALAIFADRPLLAEPGTRYHYSSFGYTLLTAMIEAATGRVYPDLLATEILQPFGLPETGPDDLAHRPESMTTLYTLTDGVARPAPVRDYSYSWGGAGMRASAGDVARFGLGHLDPALTPPETWDTLQATTRLVDGQVVSDRGYRVGLGWRRMTDPLSREVAFHTGVIVGGRSALLVYPEESIAVALLANSGWVAQIDRTAALLAAPVLETRPLDSRAGCPETDLPLAGYFDGQAMTARLILNERDGLCLGTLELDGGLEVWLAGFNPASRPYPLFALSSQAGHSVWLLATPVGLADIHMEMMETGPRLTASWGARALTLSAAPH